MAAFHLSAKIHSRARGASAIRAAAYRAGERLEDRRAGRHEDYTRKGGVIGTAILAPEGAGAWVQERQDLWNRVEAREARKDAQLAQELEINLPRELSDEENWRLVTDFARAHLVSAGRVCDVAFHKGRAADGGEHPHAHILMPLRVLTSESFGEKHPHCDWRTFFQRRDPLKQLREDWATFARERAAELGIDLGREWDHRSYAERGIELEGQPKQGATAQRMERQGKAADRTAELLAARRRNGERLLANPALALDAITARQSTFTDADLATYVFRHADETQFPQIMAKARAAAVPLGTDADNRPRFSTVEMMALEEHMVATASRLADGRTHIVSERRAHTIISDERLSAEQAEAARHLLTSGDLSCLIGYAGAGKSTMLAETRSAWTAQGYNVRGAALSGIAAANLTNSSGIEDARTIASLEHAWERGSDLLTSRDVLVVDEAGMVGSRGLSRLLDAAQQAGAKVVLVGDAEQLQAIEAGAAFRAIAERVPTIALTEVRRQHAPWQRDATRELATGQTAAALQRYAASGDIVIAETSDAARATLVAGWADDRAAEPGKSRIMLAHTNVDTEALNRAAREMSRATGDIEGPEHEIQTSRGARAFARGDRVLFRRNDRTLNVRNGTLGTVEAIGTDRFVATLDDGGKVELNPRAYCDLDHGYAVTIHKAQGVTVDRTHVLATRGFDRHLTYVACSRHREQLRLVASRDAFGDDAELARVLGRRRAKDTTLDYREATMSDTEDRAPQQRSAPTTGSAAGRLAPAPRPTQDFIDAHTPSPIPATSKQERDEIADAFAAWGTTEQKPERDNPERKADSIEDMLRGWAEENLAPERPAERQAQRDRGPDLKL